MNAFSFVLGRLSSLFVSLDSFLLVSLGGGPVCCPRIRIKADSHGSFVPVWYGFRMRFALDELVELNISHLPMATRAGFDFEFGDSTVLPKWRFPREVNWRVESKTFSSLSLLGTVSTIGFSAIFSTFVVALFFSVAFRWFFAWHSVHWNFGSRILSLWNRFDSFDDWCLAEFEIGLSSIWWGTSGFEGTHGSTVSCVVNSGAVWILSWRVFPASSLSSSDVVLSFLLPIVWETCLPFEAVTMNGKPSLFNLVSALLGAVLRSPLSVLFPVRQMFWRSLQKISQRN